jgi:hypothetical protein
MITEPQTSPKPPPLQPRAVAVYNVARPGAKDEVDQIVVYGHSNLFYWWPVWLVAFVLAGATWAEADRTTTGSSVPGAVFVLTLLVVALSSTVLLRGMVSLVAGVAVITLSVTLAWFGWWDDIFGYLGGLDIRINAAGYLCIGVPLFLAWLAVVLVYDRQHYVVFGRGQVRYVQEVGDSEMVMQSEGATVEKKRSDAFRHWILGLGAGDLIVRGGGQDGPTIELENVLNIRRKLKFIEQMLREKAVTVD